MDILALPFEVASATVTTGLSLLDQPSVEELDTQPSKENISPNLYSLAEPMIDLSGIVYGFTTLRKKAANKLFDLASEKGLLKSRSEMFSDNTDFAAVRNAAVGSIQSLKAFEKTGNPQEAEFYLKCVNELKELGEKYTIGPGDMALMKDYISMLYYPKAIHEIKADFTLHSEWMKLFLSFFGGKEFNLKAILDCCDKDPDAKVVHVDDSHAIGGPLSRELTYAIAVSEKYQQIYVVFRGSITANDWITNIQVNMCDLLLPGFTSKQAENDKKINFGKVHFGFYEYLFKEPQSGGISKGEEIAGFVRGLKDKYPSFRIAVTGHSLGGALSTMMAFRLAALNDFPDTKIMNISFASPFVGNQTFRNSFQKLEKQKKLMHLRISNDGDAVPLIPPTTLTSIPPIAYKHVGVNLRLYKTFLPIQKKFRISYPTEDSLVNEVRNAAHNNILTAVSPLVINKHLCPEYTDRLDNCMEELKSITLDELYANEKLTGWKFDEVPEKTA